MTPRNPVIPKKTPSKKKSQQVITENFMEKVLDVLNQNVQDALKKFQDTKSKEYEKKQRQ
jgi:hypothetical protein